MTIVGSELKQKLWNSPLQLIVGGLILYYVAMVLGSGYACGPGNSNITEGVFTCVRSEMSAFAKLCIVMGVAVASLCMGRAVSLLEKRWYNAN